MRADEIGVVGDRQVVKAHEFNAAPLHNPLRAVLGYARVAWLKGCLPQQASAQDSQK